MRDSNEVMHDCCQRHAATLRHSWEAPSRRVVRALKGTRERGPRRLLSLPAASMVLCIVGAQTSAAQSSNATQATAANASAASCSATEYHQFDYWVGDWDSYDSKGALQGHTRVEKILGGCALQEYYRGVEGNTGRSFTIYDNTRKVWNQTWISSRGTLLPFEGYLTGSRISLMGWHLGADGRPVLHRTVWEPLPNGRVHQVWDYSSNGGQSWEIMDDGLLRRADATSVAAFWSKCSPTLDSCPGATSSK